MFNDPADEDSPDEDYESQRAFETDIYIKNDRTYDDEN